MENKKNLVILIIAGVLVFLIGGALGVISQQTGSDSAKIEASKNFSSKVISSVTGYGKVTKIDGRNLTLNFLGDSLTVLIQDNAKVYSFVTSAADKKNTAPVVTQQAVAFEKIKVGDNVNVSLKLQAAGNFEGALVVILPVSEQTK